MNPIVVVNVSITAAPAPNLLQKTGAVISQGGTTLAAGTRQLLSSATDLTAIKQIGKAITTLAWAGSLVTVTTAAPHGIPVGHVVPVTIAGAAPTAYNGDYLGTSTGASTFTYPLVSNPGAMVTPGTYIPQSVAEVQSMVDTFFSQGSQQAVYVLELGLDDAASGVAALITYIGNNPSFFYSYLVPRNWADAAAFVTLVGQYVAPDKKTYFFTTMTLSNYDDFLNKKSVIGMVQAPAAPAAEFSHAADFRRSLNYRPTATNRVAPFAFGFLYNVTNYPVAGNVANLTLLEDNFVNYVGTGAEGDLSNKVLFFGTTMDGQDFTYWYSVDWVQINVQRNLAAMVINGSNNAQNPLYYNQDGINRGQAVIASVMSQGVSAGLVLGTPVQVQMDPADFVTAVENGEFAGVTAINAQDFISYSVANPNDYAEGLYTGYQLAYTPARGFKQIVVALNVTDFVAQ